MTGSVKGKEYKLNLKLKKPLHWVVPQPIRFTLIKIRMPLISVFIYIYFYKDICYLIMLKPILKSENVIPKIPKYVYS